MTDFYYTNNLPAEPEHMKLSRRINRSGIPGAKDEFLHFEHEVYWLRESETQIVAVHGGERLTEFCTYNDFYGLATSIEGAIEEAEKLKKLYKITKNSTLVLEALFSLKEVAVLKVPDDGGRQKYCFVPKDWYARDNEKERLWLEAKNMEETMAADYRPLMFTPRVFFHEKVIWHSKMTAGQARESIETWQQAAKTVGKQKEENPNAT